MTDNLITWNVRNWITVFLMFLAGWAIISLGVRFVRGKSTGGNSNQESLNSAGRFGVASAG